MVDDLANEGMGYPETACQSAKLHGCIPSDAMFVINYWRERKPAWGIGLLYKVIKNLHPDRSVTWPEPSEEYKKQVAKTANGDKVEKQINGRIETQRGREKAAAERAELESEFGAKLNAMSLKKVRAFLESRDSELLKVLPPKKPFSPTVRLSLLSELRNAAKQPTLISESPSC